MKTPAKHKRLVGAVCANRMLRNEEWNRKLMLPFISLINNKKVNDAKYPVGRSVNNNERETFTTFGCSEKNRLS